MKSVYVILLLLLLSGCSDVPEVTVEHSGALMEIMSGTIEATIPLDNLQEIEHLYALGALEHLQGEIQIFDGEAVISSVEDTVLKITNTWDKSAALLVYASVKEWDEFEIPKDVISKASLEQFVQNTAKQLGYTREQAFPFLIEGTPESLDWHVIKWDVNDMVHTHEKHQNSGLRGKLDKTLVTILGFYSELHKGVFTHHTANMHLHFRTKDKRLAGHVDDFRLASGMKLKLPKRAKS
jgi:acetolactate decarboxylase